eukprot:187642_1
MQSSLKELNQLIATFDVSQFNVKPYTYIQCDGWTQTFKECNAVNRLIVALKHYASLDVMINKNHADVFINFIHNIYGKILDDYIHLQKHHSHELYEINQLLTKEYELLCDMSTCKYTSRHYEEIETKNVSDPTLNFYIQTMDSLHFYLFHALRTVKVDSNDKPDEHQQDDQYFDSSFARISALINDRKHIMSTFNRFKCHEKFKINVNNNNVYDQKHHGSDTYIDHLMQYLDEKDIKKEMLEQIKHFINFEQYDTEAFLYDMENNDNSNIIWYINNISTIEKINAFIKLNQSSSLSFNIGIRFYYWQHFKHLKNVPENEQRFAFNINDHSGYSIDKLYIEKKYNSFKEEIANYKHISFYDYQHLVVQKAMRYQY